MTERNFRDLLGPYLLGDLSAGERSELEEHLESCARCRQELEELRASHEFLQEPADASPPPELKDQILSRVGDSEHEPPHHRQRVLQGRGRRIPARTLITAAMIIGALSLGGALVYGIPDQGQTVELASTDLAPDAGGEVHVTRQGENYEVDLDLRDLPAPDDDGYYELWFVSGEERISAGTFRVDPEGSTSATLNAPSTIRSYPAVGISREQDDGDPMPSGEKVLGAEPPGGWEAAAT